MSVPTISSVEPHGPIGLPGNRAIPPLENGDRLTREEFERRYDAMPALKNGELIEGMVYIRHRTRHRQHAAPHARMVGWLGHYAAFTPGTEPGTGSHLRLDRDNMPQPDALLLIQPEYAGQARIDEDDYLAGAPELVAEVVSSRASYDFYEKMGVYYRHGVRESIVWRVLDGEIDWFVRREGIYLPSSAGSDGILRSEVFPGLWLDPAALLRGNVNGVLAALRRGLESPEHAEFVARLARDRRELPPAGEAGIKGG